MLFIFSKLLELSMSPFIPGPVFWLLSLSCLCPVVIWTMPCCPHSHSRRCHPWPCLPIASHFFSKLHYWIVHQHVNGLLSPITILCLFFYQNFCWNFQKLKVSRTGYLISGKTPGWPLELVRRENRILDIPQWEEQGWRLWHEFGCVDESSS